MTTRTRNMRRAVGSAVFGLVVIGSSAPAHAQTWMADRSTPFLLDVSTIDATGEANWPYGAEDVAGNGLDTFPAPEQGIDFRTVYAAASSTHLWLRAYVALNSNVGQEVRLLVFVDNDRNAATGGPATFVSFDPRLDTDPSPGGYEYVVVVGSDESFEGLWRWSEAASDYEAVDPLPEDVEVETGVDGDPIRIALQNRAYLQFAMPLSALELNASCQAHLFVRSLNDLTALGPGDLEVGEPGRCVPASGGDTRPPEVLVPAECTEDAQCPAGGLCIDGHCVIPNLCRDDSHCDADEVCEDGLCVFDSSTTSCSEDAECGDLVCDTSQSICVACTNDASCGDGRRCAVSGRCVDGSDGPSSGGTGGTSGTGGSTSTGGSGAAGLQEGETIQGGAFTCSWAAPWSTPGWPLWLLGLGTLARGWRKRGENLHRRSRSE